MPTAKLYLPKTADRYAEALEWVKREFATEYGGYTAYHGQGGWVNDAGDLIEEPVTVIETAADSRTFGHDMNKHVRETAVHVKGMTGESTIMVVRDGDKWLA